MQDYSKTPRTMALAACVATFAALLAGCSGSSEDVRVKLCKNLSTALQRAQTFAGAVVGIRGATPENRDFYTPFIDDWS